MSEPTAPVDPAVVALVDNEAAAQDQVADNLVAALMALWAPFAAFYVGEAVAALGQQMARLVVIAQRQAGMLTEAHLRQQSQWMGIDLPATIVELPADLRMGAETADVYQRPVRQVRYLESTDIPLDEAVQTATERLESIARTDLILARTTAAQQVTYEMPERVIGYRRVVHPELTRSGPCGLCIAAADRVYQKRELMPLHDRCACTQIPVIAGQDPGKFMNEADLAALYTAAGGSTSTGALARVRYAVQQNGELGPILTPAQVRMRELGQVKRDMSPRTKNLRKQQLQRQVAEMQNRTRRTQWEQDRLEQLQELLAAA